MVSITKNQLIVGEYVVLTHVTEEAANAGDDLVSIYSAAQIIMTQTLAMIYNELIELMGGLITEGNENE